MSGASSLAACTGPVVRVRRRVIKLCEGTLAKGVTDDKKKEDSYEKFWLQGTLVEALYGIGEKEQAEELKAKAVAEAPEQWMVKSLDEQLGKLKAFLDAQSSLLA